VLTTASCVAAFTAMIAAGGFGPSEQTAVEITMTPNPMTRDSFWMEIIYAMG
jgi:hypothetical protein